MTTRNVCSLSSFVQQNISNKIHPNQKPTASHEEDRDNWPEVDRWKRSAPEADRRRGSELDDGSDVDDSRAGNVERVSLRGLRWEMTVNEREWMRPDLIKWKKKKKEASCTVPEWAWRRWQHWESGAWEEWEMNEREWEWEWTNDRIW